MIGINKARITRIKAKKRIKPTIDNHSYRWQYVEGELYMVHLTDCGECNRSAKQAEGQTNTRQKTTMEETLKQIFRV